MVDRSRILLWCQILVTGLNAHTYWSQVFLKHSVRRSLGRSSYIGLAVLTCV